MNVGLHTPTDWNAEAELLKKYLSSKVDTSFSSRKMFEQLMTTGILFINVDESLSAKIFTFDEWKHVYNFQPSFKDKSELYYGDFKKYVHFENKQRAPFITSNY